MTPTELKAKLDRNEMVSRNDHEGFACSMWRQGGYYVMVRQCSDSTHQIADDSSPERIQAHWDGFCRVQAPAPAYTPAPGLKALDHVSYFRNQGDRDGEVLAVLGDEALIAYEMPSGVTYLNIVAADGSDEPGKYRAVSAKGMPKKWREAVAKQYGEVVLGVNRCGGLTYEKL